MTFSLKNLLLVAAVVPPAVWLFFLAIAPTDPDRPPPTVSDPLFLISAAAWIVIYYNLVHKRLPG